MRKTKYNYRLVNHSKTIKKGGAKKKIYVVLENSDEYPCYLYDTVYSTYSDARKAVLEKYKELLDEEIADVAGYEGGIMASNVDVEEDQSGITNLYIEMGIHISIKRYEVDVSKKKHSKVSVAAAAG